MLLETLNEEIKIGDIFTFQLGNLSYQYVQVVGFTPSKKSVKVKQLHFKVISPTRFTADKNNFRSNETITLRVNKCGNNVINQGYTGLKLLG